MNVQTPAQSSVNIDGPAGIHPGKPAKNAYIERFKRNLTTEICGFVRGFQNIKISYIHPNTGANKSVFVHPPYMLQSISLMRDPEKFGKLKERHQIRLQNVKTARGEAGEQIRAFLNGWFYDENGRERYISSGRADRAEIRQLLQCAVDTRIIPISADGEYPTGKDLRNWLKKYGIGIDCSGFVEQLLKRLLEFFVAEGVRNSIPDVGFLRCGWVYRSITENNETSSVMFHEVKTPSQARPGDILVNSHHMRVVVSVEKVENDGAIIELAESTSASDIPSGERVEDDDIGPRRIQIKYPKSSQPISNQVPFTKRLVDSKFSEDRSEKSYVIGRYQELERVWQNL